MAQKKEILMHLRPKTSHEKLLWERKMNEILMEERDLALDESAKHKLEVGVIREQMNRMKSELKTTTIGALVLKNQRLIKQNSEKDQAIRKAKLDQNSLMESVIRLQKTGSIVKSKK